MKFNKLIINHIPLWRGQTLKGVKYGAPLIDVIIRNIIGNKIEIESNYIDEKILNKTDNYKVISNIIQDYIHPKINNIQSGELIINLGGDHGISVGTIPPILNKFPDLKVLWFDAHADINSVNSSISGNFHGMPVNIISELSHNNNPLLLKNLSYFGIRDLDEAEKIIIKENEINSYSINELKEKSIKSIVDDVINYHNLEKNKVHLSIDIDGIDPKYCPSTGTKSDNGMELDDVCNIIKNVKDLSEIVSIDLVEFNPLIGNEQDVEQTFKSIEKLLNHLLN
jgi:arginase